MDKQPSIDYMEMFSGLVQRLQNLTKQRDETDIEITKLKELILATFPLLPEDKQEIFQNDIEKIEEEGGSLLDAIKLVFSRHKGEWLTPTDVREHLSTMGYSFARYRANPLASITTTLKRMVPGRMESKTMDNGQVAYRRWISVLDRIGEEARADFAKRYMTEIARGQKK